MKCKRLWWIIPALLVLFTAVSCKSTPPEQAPDPAAPAEVADRQAPAVDMAALNAAAARAQSARQLVSDFSGPEFFPSDWQAAESLYTQAGQQRRSGTTQEAQESAARFNSAADAFEAMTPKTLAQYYENVERDIDNARGAAVAAGAAALAPDFLLEADKVVVDAMDKYEANEYYAARDAAVKALSMYSTLTVGVQAFAVRQRVAANAQTLAPEALAEADLAFANGYEKWEAGEFAGAKTDAELALVLFSRAGASAERQRALNSRANVAVRQDFNSTQAIYSRANTAYQERRFEEAGRLFRESETMFGAAARQARERRVVAEEALRRANDRISESNETARAAERILEGDVQ